MTDNLSHANDPSVQGTLPGGSAEAYSLAEIEVLCKKAARGAGYSWGLAEEAGKAARALAGYGLPAADLLAALLRANEGRSYEALRPDASREVWRAGNGNLCPLAAGAALSDRGHEIAAGRIIELGPTDFPLLLLFSAGLVSRHYGIPVTVSWPGVSVTCADDELRISGSESDLGAVSVQGLSLAAGESGTASNPRGFSSTSRPVDADRWRILEDYAFRIYAPATEQSRAGAGWDTNDQN